MIKKQLFMLSLILLLTACSKVESTPVPTIEVVLVTDTAVPQPCAVIAPDNAAQVTELALRYREA
jgi:uncharacterized lipoprotein YajG